MPADVSVVIVTYNSAAWIGPCLTSLSRQSGDVARLELIVVDNASTDGTAARLRDEHPDVVLLANATNRGFATAVNQGVAAARGTILVLLNPDTTAEEGYLRALAAFAETHGSAWIAGGRLREPDGSVQPSCWRSPSLWTVLLEAALPYQASLGMVTTTPGRTGEVETVSGASLMIPRAVFERLGGFDERFFMYYEDFDLCMRARRQGISVFHLVEAAAVHHARRSTAGDEEGFFRYVYQNKLEIIRKHESGAAAVLAYLIILASILLRIPAYAIAGTLTHDEELRRLSRAHARVLPRFAALFSLSGTA